MSFSSGFRDAAKETIGDALKLKGLRDSAGEIKKMYHGRYKDLLNTPMGRGHLSKAIVKSAPSAAALTAYGIAGKKIIDKMNEPSAQDLYQQYQY